MSVTKSAIYRAIESLSGQFVLNTGATPSGNVFNTWDAALTAALALPGIKRISIESNVTVSSGSYGAGLDDIELICPNANEASVTFDGTATHTSFFRYVENVEFECLGATVTPFNVASNFYSKLEKTIVSTDGVVPLLNMSGSSAQSATIDMNDCYISGDAVGPCINLIDSTSGPLLTINATGDCTFAVDAFATNGAGLGSFIVVNDNCRGGGMDPAAPQTHVAARFDYHTFGKESRASYTGVNSNTTYYKPNIDIEMSTGTAVELTFDFSDCALEPGNFIRLNHGNISNGEGVTLTLASGSFFGGNNNRRVLEYNSVHYMEYTPDGWMVRGPQSIERALDEEPLHVSLRNTNVPGTGTFTTIFSRDISAAKSVCSVVAYITAREATSGDKAFYRLEGVATSDGASLDLDPIGGLKTIIHEEDANMDVQLSSSGPNLLIQCSHTASAEWYLDATFYIDDIGNP